MKDLDLPAFPSGMINCGSEWADFPYLGMSLRDYFAGQALIGLCANPIFVAEMRGFYNGKLGVGHPQHSPECTRAMCFNAYATADAMLQERALGRDPAPAEKKDEARS